MIKARFLYYAGFGLVFAWTVGFSLWFGWQLQVWLWKVGLM